MSEAFDPSYVVPAGHVLVLRTCRPDGGSPNIAQSNGFVWPRSGPGRCADWDPEPECGHGLHGFLWGEGDGLNQFVLWWDDDALWLVVEVEEAGIVDLDGKCKFEKGVVLGAGSREAATGFIVARAPQRAVIGAMVTVGDDRVAVAGDNGTATAGNRGIATAGDFGTATAGDGGTATAGDNGTATAGYRGTATAGDNGTATAGDYGTATAGYRGTATAGYGGTLIFEWWDGNRQRIATAYVGEDGIEAGVAYRCENGKPVRG